MTRRVTVSLATMPHRQAWAEQVVRALRPQCDRLVVTLNRYDEAAAAWAAVGFAALGAETRVGSGPAAEKFDPMLAMLEQARGSRGYLLTCDDDILYPADYVARMTRTCAAWSGRAVVTAHGSLLVGEPRTIADYIWQTSFTRECSGEWCTLPGTGVMAMDLDALPEVAMRDLWQSLDRPNADDATYAVWAQRHAIPIRMVPRQRGWLYEIEPHHEGLWKTCVDRTSPIVAEWPTWRLHAIPARLRIGEEPLSTGGRPRGSIAKAVTRTLSDHRTALLADAIHRGRVADAVVAAVRSVLDLDL